MTVVLVGPTAAGKSSLAIDLALRFRVGDRDAEIVNADSMLLYRGMDIGTAKPSLAERRGVRHHLIDILNVTETSTVANFQQLARRAIADCRSRGVVPIVVGGSALYVRAIVDDFRFPGTDPVLRAELEAELSRTGPEALHRRLAQLDPAAASTIEPGNGRRIVRALEVGRLTGGPFQARLPVHEYFLPDVLQIGLDIDRAELDRRIASRVHDMWQNGFVHEVQGLVDAGLRHGRTASRALGYRQALGFLAGHLTESEAYQQTVLATRRFARRQDSWFRKDPRIRWLPNGDPVLTGSAYRLAEVGEAGFRSPSAWAAAGHGTMED